MSFITATPEFIQCAAQDLASVHSSLAEAAIAAAGPTTGLAAAAQDEISVALASLFGNFGQDFQALHTQAQTFHEKFINLINAGTDAYVAAEVANIKQTLLSEMVRPPQLLFPSPNGTAAAAGPLDILNSFGATIAAPYQMLVSNTVKNLQSLQSGFLAHPTPYEHPIMNQQTGYPQLITTSLQEAGSDFMAGLNALPAKLQTAARTIMSGDATGGLLQVGGAFLTPLFSGLNVTLPNPQNLVFNIAPVGALGDLLPILGIPAQMAQDLTNLLPAGSIPAMMAQKVTNDLATLTDLSMTFDILTLKVHVGLPLVLALGALGPPVTTLQAIESSSTAFIGAVQNGDGLGAVSALAGAPALMADGFLNGHATLELPASIELFGGAEAIITIPLGGILTPPQPAAMRIPILGPNSLTLAGTRFGGILPGLLTLVEALSW